MRWTLSGSSGVRAGRWARISALCCIVLLAALMPAAQAEVAPQEADVTLDYGCQLAPGPRQVNIQVKATFPGNGVVGQPIQPTDVSVRVTLPPATVADLTQRGATTVAGAVNLGMAVAQNGKSSDAAWSGLAAPATPLPAAGGLTLEAAGPVPPATVRAPGDVGFTAGVLGLILAPKKADGSATDPPTMPLACTLDPGQGARLVTVPVSKSSTPTTSPTASSGPETTSQEDRPRGIITGPGADVQAQTGSDVYEEMDVLPAELCSDPSKWIQVAPTLRPASVYLAGHSNISKLRSALVLGYPVPALLKGDGGQFRVPTGPGPGDYIINPDTRGWALAILPSPRGTYQCTFVLLDIRNQGRGEFPPARGTFSHFGFMPVTATTHLTQVWNEPITTLQFVPPNIPGKPNAGQVVSTGRVSLRLSDVTVNGVPLDVGGDCRTTETLTSPGSPFRPDQLVLLGGGLGPKAPTPRFSTVRQGGAVAGVTSIPSFSGCVSSRGEDLDPLLNATVSGSDNYLKLIMGPVCLAAGVTDNCTEGSAGGDPTRLPYWTVSNGGSYTSTGTVSFRHQRGSSQTLITCDSVVSGAIADMTGPPRGNLGPVRFSFPRPCTGSGNTTWEVEQRGVAGLGAFIYNPATREVNAKVTNVSLQLTGDVPGVGSCTAVATVHAPATYSNPPDSRLVITAGTVDGNGGWIESSTCLDDVISLTGPFWMGADYDLGPSEITITSPPASEVVGP